MANHIHGSILLPPKLIKSDSTCNRFHLIDYFIPALFLRNFHVKMVFTLGGLLRIYNRALSQSEIMKIVASGFGT